MKTTVLKSRLSILFPLCLAVLFFSLAGAKAETVAYWNFNGLSISAASTPGSGGVPTAISADQGVGNLSLTGYAGNVDDFTGSTINAQGTDAAEESLSLAAGGSSAPFPGNGSYIEVQIDMSQFADPVITFATRGTSTGYDTGTWSYSVGGGAFTDLAGNTATRSTTFALATVDMTAINAVDGQTDVRLRYTLSGATSSGGNNRIDNLLVSATLVNDTAPPAASSFVPADDATGVPVTAAPSIVFNEAIQKGSGDILIKRTSDGSLCESIAVGSMQVAVSGSTATITPASFFANSTGYYVEVPAGAFEDLAGNDYAGLSGAGAWNFTAVAPAVLPMATETFTGQTRVQQGGSSSTADYYAEGNGQGNFAVYGFGTFNFSKLDFALSGATTITGIDSVVFTLTHNDRDFTEGTEVEFFFTTDSSAGKTFNATLVNGIDPSQYSFAPISLGKFTYTPEAGGSQDVFVLDFSAAGAALISRINTGEDFSILMAATEPSAAITYSGKGNTFDPGDPELKITVTETTGTDTAPPTVAFFTPADGSGGFPISQDLKVSFNELVQKGTGNITIFRTADDSVFEAVDAAGPRVSVSLGTVTIDPANALEPAGSYYVQIAPGAVEDVSGNDFAGIADTTTWNFSTAQPPITAPGPFEVSENAPAGAVLGALNPNVLGKEGIRYAILGGSGGATMVKPVAGTGYGIEPLFTIGDTFEGATGVYNASSAGSFSPVGVLDGIGAYLRDAQTVRIFVNHEIALPTAAGTAGYPFTLANGTVIAKGAARISYFDIDKTSRRVVDAGLAIRNLYDRAGNIVTSTSQLDLGGLDRFCSASLYEPEQFGPGRGLVDRIYFAGEETGTGFGHPHGGTQWALDVATGDLWALPDFGRGEWENVAMVDTGTTTHVAFVMGDDTQGSPLYLYVGQKNGAPGAGFVERNGLSGGQLYVWKATNGNTTPQQFFGTGAVRAGTWVPIAAKDPSKAGLAGHDAVGYKNDATLAAEADTLGAFSFSRPEDVATNPADGTMVAFNSTGRGNLFPQDNWGIVYVFDLDFTNLAAPTASARILYDANDMGGGQFASPEAGLRCPDNLDWADDGSLYVQEDQANQQGSFGAAGFETSIWRLDAATGAAARVAMVDRSTVLPLGSTDGAPSDVGNWETSGILDISALFGEIPGSLFLFNIQAHSVSNGPIAAKDLFQGGQICFLEKGPEQGAFAINPNTGVITLANPAALDLEHRPSHTLRLQAYDGTNATFDTIAVEVNNDPVARSNAFEVATFNVSHFRSAAGVLASDLVGVGNTNSQKIARIIQRNNPDVILLNEFDYDAAGLALKRFKENYLEVGQSGEAPVYYPYAFIAPSNTGVHSGFDLDNNDAVVSTPGASGYGEDAFGFGDYEGQYAFVVLSKYPIDTDNIRTFQRFLWKDMPGALLPDNPNVAGAGDWFSAAELGVFRLSSKNHADVPVLVNGTPVHILASHPTPPVFDDPGSGLPWIAGVDQNGRRNSDEIRFWSDYVNPSASGYIYDDAEWEAAGNTTPAIRSGGLPPDTRFVICGDQNADNDEGDSTDPAIKQLIGGLIGGSPVPANAAVNPFVPGGGAGGDPDDTAGFSGGVRVDYALPSNFGLTVDGGAVFWPASGSGDPIVAALDATDHRLVYLNLTLSGATAPPSTDLASYYAPASGLAGAALQAALQGIIDDHTVIDYNSADEIMQVLDAANATDVRLLYSNANLPKTSFFGAGLPDEVSWNREHVWPRNDGVGETGPDFSDLHHLFPCQVNVNSLRSARPFDEGEDDEHDPFAPESFWDYSQDTWEPLDRDKGVVARAALYMMTRYDGSDPGTTDLVLENNPSFAGTDMGILDTLLAWHRAFPPSGYERGRNDAIFAGVPVGAVTYAQGNRNPFIDIPQFADAIFLGAGENSFAKWQFKKFTIAQLLDPDTSGLSANPDGDPLSNYDEFLFNGDPLGGADSGLAIEPGAGPGQFTLIFHRPKGVAEQADIRTKTDLKSAIWTPVPGWEAASTIIDLGDYERVEYPISIDPETALDQFWIVVFE